MNSLRLSFVAFLLLFVLSGPVRADEPRIDKRPNIIVIMADDLGFSDIGCYGSEIATPNLDRLAKEGLRFTQFYNTARCCPSRASLMTGLYSHQAGVGYMDDDHHLPAYIGRLNERCVTIAEALQPAGYRTLMSGKWHLGGPPHSPADRGFDDSFVGVGGAFNYFRPDQEKFLRNREIYKPNPDKFYLTDAITDQAISFIDDPASKQRPYFLYVAYTSPHWPLHAWPEDIAKYRGKYMAGWQHLREKRYQRMIELGIIQAKWPLTPLDEQAPKWETLSEKDKEERDLRMAVYAAQIDRMDQNIGRILQELQKAGTLDNTLIMYLADNGGCAEKIDRGKPGAPAGTADSFLSYGLPWANASNTPFRLYKHWVHEGGIATPFIAHWPGVIKPDSMTDQVGHIIDVMATCVDVAKAEYPKEYHGAAVTPLEGRSLLPIFEGRTRPGHETIFWEHEGNRAVRQGNWKLVSRYQKDWSLFDLDTDRTEMKDLSKEQPAKVKELSALYDAWAKRVGVVPWSELVRK